ncbi:helix-turn-helix transcriptional regulator [Devosia sp.]|uniref:helix-turn-helix transcriptional regulator n=1 Tax=Devosia sp. TaxID=1871048 RepID=UPI001ACC7151|nr:helix-turn-helix transcriptional regulator [Devosia sp.]MBN9332788.1 helix-turn-helix transcriptional regulator [Devosia sp.]
MWPRAMQEICDELAFRTGVISVLSLPGGEPILAATTGFEEPWLDRVFYYTSELVDLWGGDAVIRSLPLDEPAVLSAVNPAAIADEHPHPFHEAFNRPQGFVDALAIGLTRDDGSIGTIGFNRHADAGLVGPREIEIMQLLLPHLQRAATISRVLEARSIAARQFSAVLDGLTAPIAVVGTDLDLKYANPALNGVLTLSERNLDLVDGQLRLRFAPAQKMLTAALRQAETAGYLPGAAAFGLPIGASTDSVRSLHILPLPPSAADGPLFAIVLAPLSLALESAGPMVASVFGLTRAEQRVFEEIAAGQSVEQVADQLGVAISTVRTHLLRLFAKTETSRQAELVTLAASFLPMTRP